MRQPGPAMPVRTRALAAGLMIGAVVNASSGQPASLVSLGDTLYRVNKDGTNAPDAIETFVNQPGVVIAMTLVPVGVFVVGCQAGDVLAVETGNGGRVWRIDGARQGTPRLVQIGQLPPNLNVSSVAFAHGDLFSIDGGAVFRRLDTSSFVPIGTAMDLFTAGSTGIGGLAFNGADAWFLTNGDSDRLIRLADPPTAASWTVVGDVGVTFDNSGLEMYGTQLWGALRGQGGNLRLGSFDLANGVFTESWNVNPSAASLNVGIASFGPECLDVSGQPDSRTTCPSARVSFSVEVVGTQALEFRWQVESPSGSGAYVDLPSPVYVESTSGLTFEVEGETTSTLTIDRVRLGARPNPVRLRVHVSSACGSTNSLPAELTVCPVDLDGGPLCDGAVTVDDLLFMLSAFDAGNIAADLDDDGDPAAGTPDGAVTIEDLLFFLARFEVGC